MKKPEDLQGYFNNAWEWFVVQKNPPSMNSSGNCLYRGPNGARCALGCSIPDEKYSTRLEAMYLLDIVRQVGLPLVEEDALRKLQRCHDHPAAAYQAAGYLRSRSLDEFLMGFKTMMIKFAEEWHLSIPTNASVEQPSPPSENPS